mmetsp:Transcript_805/g.1348  ORF Transcript_805/g.1348 Transcript_805/m.1348 type:complete len:122 (-) Transcript_805:96-461(-)|eukprot:CAMPEP_0185034472 /NCGR_PEP_ID=MMETSP1103-20130426/24404_1 /TAXON_ID=36769 /ORGANISM="Paraphysomonas bandaiensis, Strain Caron Lab Isolate" /LENGTH=121 /DNA_ID=CAMNT_0027571145 /DNA_START=23 /DNA_END=388 /DNA_ORIENTATION=-
METVKDHMKAVKETVSEAVNNYSKKVKESEEERLEKKRAKELEEQGYSPEEAKEEVQEKKRAKEIKESLEGAVDTAADTAKAVGDQAAKTAAHAERVLQEETDAIANENTHKNETSDQQSN